jgi:nucleoid DNA-binding protein
MGNRHSKDHRKVKKGELATKVAKRLGQKGISLPPEQCERVIRELFAVIEDEVSVGNRVMIYGVGSFYPRGLSPRNYVNPQKPGDQSKMIRKGERTVMGFAPSRSKKIL